MICRMLTDGKRAARHPSAPAPRGVARRITLLEAVLRIVADVGTEAVTHRRVAEEAGLPLASTTYWFDSKEHLLTAALELAAERDVARLHAYVAELNGLPSSVDATVVAIVETLDHHLRTNRGSLIATYALLLEAARRPALQKLARDWTDVYLAALSQLLERAGSTHAGEDAVLLLGTANGLLIEEFASGRNSNLHPQLRRLTAALLSAS